MVILSGFLLWAVNEYIPINPLVNLLFNCFMLVIFVIYIMQLLGVVKDILPSPKLFK